MNRLKDGFTSSKTFTVRWWSTPSVIESSERQWRVGTTNQMSYRQSPQYLVIQDHVAQDHTLYDPIVQDRALKFVSSSIAMSYIAVPYILVYCAPHCVAYTHSKTSTKSLSDLRSTLLDPLHHPGPVTRLPRYHRNHKVQDVTDIAVKARHISIRY